MAGPGCRAKLLISPERTQKFDLLLHLIANLRQPLVVCGPEGIGKTTTLALLDSHRLSGWKVCTVVGSPELKFDHIARQLLISLVDRSDAVPDPQVESLLIQKLEGLDRKKGLLLFLFDDAGLAEPGLLERLCQLSRVAPAFRLVFAMTLDALHIKHSTDPVVDDCHIVEIPPLTEFQCKEYLQNLAARPKGMLSLKAITPALVARVYQDSHGIPGKILALLPGLVGPVRLGASAARHSFPVLLALGGVLGFFGWLWWQAQKLDGSSLAPEIAAMAEIEQTARGVSVTPKSGGPGRVPSPPTGHLQPSGSAGFTDAVMAGSPLPGRDATDGDLLPSVEELLEATVASNIALLSGQDSPGSAPMAGKSSGRPAAKRSLRGAAPGGLSREFPSMPANTSAGLSSARKAQDLAKEPAEGGKKVPATAGETVSIPGVRGPRWLMARDPEKFTLQLMASPETASLVKFVEAHKMLKGLAFYPFKKDGEDWYALVSGIYPSLSAARAGARALPVHQLRRSAWPRSLKVIQRRIRARLS